MINDNFVVTGTPTITLYSETGAIKQQFSIPNLVVQAGKNWLASRAKDATSAVMSHMAIGSGNVAPVTGNTALGTQLGIVALTSTTVSTNTVTYLATFPAGTGTGAITEAGIFNAASAGTMLARTTFNVVNKDTTDTLTISWAVTIN